MVCFSFQKARLYLLIGVRLQRANLADLDRWISLENGLHGPAR
jgi:hypothetical protein